MANLAANPLKGVWEPDVFSWLALQPWHHGLLCDSSQGAFGRLFQEIYRER